MVFVDAAIAWRDGKFAERFRKGIKQGREEERRDWLAWLERQEAARTRGEPFDEPPPGVNGHANSA